MADYQYITDTNHAERLSAALDAFHRALTRRWRAETCRAIVERAPMVQSIRQEVPQYSYQLPAPVQEYLPMPDRWEPLRWDCWSEPARYHLELGYGCEYVWWANHGQDGPLSAVSCHGSTYPELRRDGSVEMGVPERIECGMGSILEQVEDWAWAEREHVFSQLPLFDRHDVGALHEAHDALIRLGGELCLDAPAGSDGTFTDSFADLDTREIPLAAEAIADPDVSNDWLAGWTGLAARRFKSGFAASVVPTAINQSRIVGVLANLYAARAAIIEKGRRDALYWIESATVSLDQTELVHVDRTNFWVAVEGVGMATGLAFAASGVGLAVGAGIALVGFMGQNLDPGSTTEAYAGDMVEIVGRLNDEIGTLNRELGGLEIGYSSDVDKLRETIHSVHNYNLELYDLTQNVAEGDHDEPTGDREEDNDGDPGRDDTSFSADIDFVLELGKNCYRAGDLYAQLLPVIAETRLADRHLADKDGRPTLADRRLVEVRDQLGEYLKTTCGRYLMAGEQVRAAAEAYVDVDTNQGATFHSLMAEWEEDGIGEFERDIDPEEYAAATDRPWVWAPEQESPGPGGSSEPGAGADDDYATDADEEGERNDE